MKLNSLYQTVFSCNDCPRLRTHCETIARVKRRAYLHETYWGKPISGLGDPDAQLVIVGLAPAAHGANRTGRIFTGDRSGEWLYRALFKAGFSNQPHSIDRQDGLLLKNAYITCIVKCAPPDNKPNPQELRNCSQYIEQEIQHFSKAKVWIALGQMSYNKIWPLLEPSLAQPKFQPKFEHGKKIRLKSGQHLLLSYHPSQQNTFTGRLTEPMFDSVFSTARRLLGQI